MNTGFVYAITFAMISYEPDGTVRSASSGVNGIFDSLESAAEHINEDFEGFYENGIRFDRCSSYTKLISSTKKSCGGVTWTEFVEDTPIVAGAHITTHFRLVRIPQTNVHIGQ